jgi:aconitate hydratase
MRIIIENVVRHAGNPDACAPSATGSAKGVALLGVRAVLAASFERIHRSDLVGMGVLPLRLPEGCRPADLAITPQDWIEVDAPPEMLRPRGIAQVRIRRPHGRADAFEAAVAVETQLEVAVLQAGGIMPLIIARAATPGHGR